MYDLPVNAFGATFRNRGNEFRITGIHPNRPKFPISAVRTKDSRAMKFTAGAVKMYLLTATA